MKLALIAALVALTGCSSMITQENTVRTTARSSTGSERTYRNLLSAMKDCYPTNMTIEAQYFPDAKEGEIMLASIHDTFRTEFARLKVSQVGDNANVVMDSRSRFDRFPAALPNWVEADSKVCPYGTRVEAPYASQNPYASAPR
jgi:hypothetical protein